MRCILSDFGPETAVLIALSIVLLSGFIFTRITNLINLPKVSGYILAGIMIGPHMLNIIPQNLVEGMGFVSDIALAFIAFGVGQFFKKETLKETGSSVVIITLFESLLSGFLVSVIMYYFLKLDLGISLLLGGIATATAPASTVMTINQYNAKGDFVHVLLQIVALDDVVCLLVFSALAAFVSQAEKGALLLSDILLPIALNIAAVIAGAIFALILDKMISPKRSSENRLIIVVALLLGLSGICSIFDVSPLLSCMVFGAVYMNKAKDEELYHQLNVFTPPIMLIFFVVSGMNLNLKILATFGVVGVVYFIVRIVGKYIGAYLGCMFVKSNDELRNYLGAALVPQAGVAIGLAYLSQRILPADVGSLLMTIILSSSVLYELIGPACAKFALIKSGAIPIENLERPKREPIKKHEVIYKN